MHSILRSCPNLMSLVVSGTEGHVDTVSFLQSYRTAGVRLAMLECPFDDVPMLMKELMDADSRLTGTPKRMRLKSPGALAESTAAAETYYSAISKMLDVNRTLEYLDVSVGSAETQEFRPPIQSLQ